MTNAVVGDLRPGLDRVFTLRVLDVDSAGVSCRESLVEFDVFVPACPPARKLLCEKIRVCKRNQSTAFSWFGLGQSVTFFTPFRLGRHRVLGIRRGALTR